MVEGLKHGDLFLDRSDRFDAAATLVRDLDINLEHVFYQSS